MSAGEGGLRDVLLRRPPELEDLAAEYRLEPAYLAALDKPVIAALNGPTVGLGLVVSLFCDLRFAAESAKLSTAFSRLGLVAEYGVAWQLPRPDRHWPTPPTCCSAPGRWARGRRRSWAW